jgi:hypothetical protein
MEHARPFRLKFPFSPCFVVVNVAVRIFELQRADRMIVPVVPAAVTLVLVADKLKQRGSLFQQLIGLQKRRNGDHKQHEDALHSWHKFAATEKARTQNVARRLLRVALARNVLLTHRMRSAVGVWRSVVRRSAEKKSPNLLSVRYGISMHIPQTQSPTKQNLTPNA